MTLPHSDWRLPHALGGIALRIGALLRDSPPYWGLRSYHLTRWEGGDPDCEHQAKLFKSRKLTDDKQCLPLLGQGRKPKDPCLK